MPSLCLVLITKMLLVSAPVWPINIKHFFQISITEMLHNFSIVHLTTLYNVKLMSSPPPSYLTIASFVQMLESHFFFQCHTSLSLPVFCGLTGLTAFYYTSSLEIFIACLAELKYWKWVFEQKTLCHMLSYTSNAEE